MGHDSDTVAAIYGILAGAYYGVDAMPADWLEALCLKPLVYLYANELYTQSAIIVPSDAFLLTRDDHDKVLHIKNNKL